MLFSVFGLWFVFFETITDTSKKIIDPNQFFSHNADSYSAAASTWDSQLPVIETSERVFIYVIRSGMPAPSFGDRNPRRKSVKTDKDYIFGVRNQNQTDEDGRGRACPKRLMR